jgi:hypothetical protein
LIKIAQNPTFIGPSKPFKLPRRNLVIMAIQKFTLRPKRVLKMTLRPTNNQDNQDKANMIFLEHKNPTLMVRT